MNKTLIIFSTILLCTTSYVSYGNFKGKKLFCKDTEGFNNERYHFNFGEILNHYAYSFEDEKVHYYYFFRNNDKILFKKSGTSKYVTNENQIEWIENWSETTFQNKLDRKTLILKSKGNYQPNFFQCKFFISSKWENKKKALLDYFQKKYDERRLGNKF